jgi:hypothetical protein
VKRETVLANPAVLRRFHAGATGVWALMVVPTLVWWSESVWWIALMSVWANIAGHWSAWQAARSETKNDDDPG